MNCMLLIYDISEKVLGAYYNASDDVHTPIMLDIPEDVKGNPAELVQEKFFTTYKQQIPVPTYVGSFTEAGHSFSNTFVFTVLSDTVHSLTEDGLDTLKVSEISDFNIEEKLDAVLKLVEIEGLKSFKVLI